jgi:hypothetical protein
MMPDHDGIEGLCDEMRYGRGFGLIKATPSQLLVMKEMIGRGGRLNARGEVLVVGGETLSWKLVRDWTRVWQGGEVVNEYGPTEATVGCCVKTVKEEEATKANKRGDVPIGRPIMNARMYIVDGWDGLTGEGVIGEICIGGEGLARGYLKDPAKTAEMFAPDQYGNAGERVYRSGDLGKRIAGEIAYIGRKDGQVKIRGFRVEIGEIEWVLNNHEAVNESVVVARDWEEGDRRLIGYVAGRVGLNGVELKEYLSERLPDYMVPSVILVLDRLPLTINGKIDRSALPDPRTVRSATRDDSGLPRSHLEETLAAMWAEVLGVQSVGIHSNFFALGGHSLLATQLTSRIQDVFHVVLPLRHFFESPTIAGLAVAIVEQQAAEAAQDDMAQILARIEQLTEEEAQSLVSTERAGDQSI